MVSIVSILILLIVSTISIDGQSATNCGGSHLSLNSFSLTPHPIKIPSGNAINRVLFNINIHAAQPITADTQVVVTLETRVLFFWVVAPCTNGVGSCTYSSVCTFCTDCFCEYPAGDHSLTLGMNMTSAVPTGAYRATIEFYRGATLTGCVYVTGITCN